MVFIKKLKKSSFKFCSRCGIPLPLLCQGKAQLCNTGCIGCDSAGMIHIFHLCIFRWTDKFVSLLIQLTSVFSYRDHHQHHLAACSSLIDEAMMREAFHQITSLLYFFFFLFFIGLGPDATALFPLSTLVCVISQKSRDQNLVDGWLLPQISAKQQNRKSVLKLGCLSKVC